jgi:thiamine-phosphate diphosphorylase
LTRLLVNDRADIAAASGADGVHLTTKSLSPQLVRQIFGQEFLIGSSTHSLVEASTARAQGADFVVLGPIFPTASKQQYGQALGLEQLKRVADELSPFPVLALGGVTPANAADCYRVGARGIAAISMLNDPMRLTSIVNEIKERIEGKK